MDEGIMRNTTYTTIDGFEVIIRGGDNGRPSWWGWLKSLWLKPGGLYWSVSVNYPRSGFSATWCNTKMGARKWARDTIKQKRIELADEPFYKDALSAKGGVDDR